MVFRGSASPDHTDSRRDCVPGGFSGQPVKRDLMSSLQLAPFRYYEPVTAVEAAALLHQYGTDAQILAGGIDLLPRMRVGSTKADHVINIQNIPELNYIKTDKEVGLEFGAMATLHSLELSSEFRRTYPMLYEAIHQITSVQSKCMGTAVGNLCVSTPASDVATALMALDAELIILGVDGARRENIANFYTGYRSTTLSRGEFVTGVSVPKAAAGQGAAFMNLVRTHADIAKVTVAVAVVTQGDICIDARIALGAVGPTVSRAYAAEDRLIGQKCDPSLIADVAAIAMEHTSPITDFRSTDVYRRQTARVLVARALETAIAQSGGR